MTKEPGLNGITEKFLSPGGPESTYRRIGFWGWLGLYASGVLLLFFLLAHIWFIHYSAAEPPSLKTTMAMFASPVVKTVEIGLLAMALIHGLIGLCRIVLDLEIFKERGQKLLIRGFITGGVIVFGWGLILFLKFASL